MTTTDKTRQKKMDTIYNEVKNIAFTLFTKYRFPLNAKKRALRALADAQAMVITFYTDGVADKKTEENTDTANE